MVGHKHKHPHSVSVSLNPHYVSVSRTYTPCINIEHAIGGTETIADDLMTKLLRATYANANRMNDIGIFGANRNKCEIDIHVTISHFLGMLGQIQLVARIHAYIKMRREKERSREAERATFILNILPESNEHLNYDKTSERQNHHAF